MQLVDTQFPVNLALRDASQSQQLQVHTVDTGAGHLVENLLEAGVDTWFGVPGGPIMPLFDAIIRSGRARLVESRHETNAVFAAMGYYRSTGRVPGIVVTAGPGATNALTGIAAAHCERVPMLIITGDVAWAANGGVLLQSMGPDGLNIEAVFKPVTRATIRVAHQRSASAQTLAALQAAQEPNNPGPALVVLPVQCGSGESRPVTLKRGRKVAQCTVGDDLLVDVADRLASARRPLIIVGAACRRFAKTVTRLVETLRVPFMTTPQAKGVISEEHPLSLRNGGMAASWWSRRYTAPGVDVALAIGTDLDDVSIGPTPPVGPGGFLIHVDTNPAVFNRNQSTHLGIDCDLTAFAKELTRVAMARASHNPYAAAPLADARRRSPFDYENFREDNREVITPHRAVHDLERAAPEATFLTDIGEHMLFGLHYLTAKGPDRFAIHLGLGSMGSGICSAIGHAYGDSSRRYICICGDGGMQMVGSEVLVAVKHKLPVVFAIFNDARYNMVYHGYKQQFGRENPWETPWVEFAQWAASMGIPSARIEKPGQISQMLLDNLAAQAGGGPVVLDIRIDPQVRIQGAGRVEALQRMSTGEFPIIKR